MNRLRRSVGRRWSGTVVIVAAMGASIIASSSPPDGAAATASGTTAPDARFTGAPRQDDRFANLYPFRLPTLGDLADWYWHWWLAGDVQAPRVVIRRSRWTVRTSRCCARTVRTRPSHGSATRPC